MLCRGKENPYDFLKRKLMIKTLNESQYHYWCVIWIFVTGKNKQIKQTS